MMGISFRRRFEPAHRGIYLIRTCIFGQNGISFAFDGIILLFFIFSTTFLFCLFTHSFLLQRTNFSPNLSIFFVQISLCLYAVVSSFPSNVETNRIESDDKDFPEAAFNGAEQTREAESELPPTDSNTEHPDQSVTSSEESGDSINQYATEQNSSELPTSTSTPQYSIPVRLPEMLLPHPVLVDMMHQFQPRCGCRSTIGFSQHYVPRPSCSCRASCPCNSLHSSNVGRMFPTSFPTSSMMSPMMLPMPPMPSVASMPSFMPPMPPMPPTSMMPPQMMKVVFSSKTATE